MTFWNSKIGRDRIFGWCALKVMNKAERLYILQGKSDVVYLEPCTIWVEAT